MTLSIKYLVGVILGEEDFQFLLDSNVSKSSSSYFKTGYGTGYKVGINELSVIICRKDKFALIFGWPPFYYFKGTIQQGSEKKVVKGRITMIWYPKYFILAWTTIVFIILIGGVIMTMFLSIEFMVSPSQVFEKHLLSAGFMFGTAASLSVFGGIVISSIKLISRNQKESLKQFCKSLYKTR